MEFLVASAVGLMTAAGVYLILRLRTFPVILGLSMLTYAVNVFLFASGRVALNLPPVYVAGVKDYTDPLPQALVLTAIVISFGMTAVIVMMSLGAFLSRGDDRIDMDDATGIVPARAEDGQ
jgi:multicomponent K+:H+ antiporter subunit C